MHLKNLALLKIVEPGAKAFASVRFAPLYHAVTVTTRIFPSLADDCMALKQNGEDDLLTMADFLALARTIGLAGGRAESAFTSIATSLATAAAALYLPDLATHSQTSETATDSVVAIVVERSARFTD